MAKLIIKGWDDSIAWSGKYYGYFKHLCGHIKECTDLKPLEIKRTARKIARKETVEIDIIPNKYVKSFLHFLQAMGVVYEYFEND